MSLKIKERPILFNVHSSAGIQKDIKTQTRRLRGLEKVNFDPDNWIYKGLNFEAEHIFWPRGGPGRPNESDCIYLPCPFGVPGEHLWVREPWITFREYDAVKPSELSKRTIIGYLADEYFKVIPFLGKHRQAMFMCRWMSRSLLKIISIRAERLQDISEKDAKAEGANLRSGWLPDDSKYGTSYQNGFAWIWDSINGPGSWKSNQWVWRIEFKRIEI